MNYDINISKIDLLILATEYINTNLNNTNNRGRWSQEEHNKFLLGLKIFGKNYNLIQNLIKTRTKVQIRSHSQKYFKKNI